jgi:hypothetical protein
MTYYANFHTWVTIVTAMTAGTRRDARGETDSMCD